MKGYFRLQAHRTSGDKPQCDVVIYQATFRVRPVTIHRANTFWDKTRCEEFDEQTFAWTLPVASHRASSSCDKSQCMVLRWQATGRVLPVTSHSASSSCDKPQRGATVTSHRARFSCDKPQCEVLRWQATAYEYFLLEASNRSYMVGQGLAGAWHKIDGLLVSDGQKQWFWLGKNSIWDPAKRLVWWPASDAGASASTTYWIMTDRNSDFDRGLWDPARRWDWWPASDTASFAVGWRARDWLAAWTDSFSAARAKRTRKKLPRGTEQDC